MDSCVFSSLLSLPYDCLSFLFLCVRRIMGSGSTGTPHYNRASWFGVGKGFLYIKPRRCPARGSGTAAAIALRAACSGL